jgi:hypothetical protein
VRVAGGELDGGSQPDFLPTFTNSVIGVTIGLEKGTRSKRDDCKLTKAKLKAEVS